MRLSCVINSYLLTYLLTYLFFCPHPFPFPLLYSLPVTFFPLCPFSVPASRPLDPATVGALSYDTISVKWITLLIVVLFVSNQLGPAIDRQPSLTVLMTTPVGPGRARPTNGLWSHVVHVEMKITLPVITRLRAVLSDRWSLRHRNSSHKDTIQYNTIKTFV